MTDASQQSQSEAVTSSLALPSATPISRTQEQTPQPQQAPPPTYIPRSSWLPYLLGPAVSIIVAVVTAVLTTLLTLQTTAARLEEKIHGYVGTIENSLNRDAEDIRYLRDRASSLEVAISNNAASANGTAGRFETAINNSLIEITSLRKDVAVTSKTIAELGAQLRSSETDLVHLKNTKLEKIAADLSNLKERLSAIEAVMELKRSKKE
jgi:hypothetical protein